MVYISLNRFARGWLFSEFGSLASLEGIGGPYSLNMMVLASLEVID